MSGFSIPPRPVMVGLAFLLLVLGVTAGSRYYFLTSSTFNVEDIVINKPAGYGFSMGEDKLTRLYRGRNIFTLDLDQIETLIRKDHPQIRNVEVKRYLPNMLEVDIVSREPFAYLDTGGGIVIDREGMVLWSGNVPGGIVKIQGISFFLTKPPTGSRIDNPSLDKALVLLEGLRRKARASGELIDHIDISDRNNIVVVIKGVEIRMGTDELSRKLDGLKEILDDPQIDMEGIRYIDLRFENPVISPR
jgi:cell division septal protein FtsQ